MSVPVPSTHTPINLGHGVAGAVPVESVHTEKATYTWTMPAQSVSANEEYFDLFNADDALLVRLNSVKVYSAFDASVTYSVGFRLHLIKTSTVGTGGTAWDASSPTVEIAGGGISPHDSLNDAIDADITGRHLPTGGATLAAWLATRHGGADEDWLPSMNGVELLPQASHGQDWVLRQNQGIKVIQGSVVSVGKLSFEVTFTIEPIV
jgi:hypothetical protein